MIKTLDWLTEVNMNELAFDYWNNEEFENEKPYAFSADNISNLTSAVKDLGVYQQVDELISMFAENKDIISMASLGAGVCWEYIVYSNIDAIRRIDFVDFSKHRIHKIAPRVCDACGCPSKKDVNLIHGSYYDLHSDDESYDCITMCEALMMAEEPDRLLTEAKRVLRRGGV